MTRLALAAAAALLVATAAQAQAPGIRAVPTVSPVPAIVLQQQQNWNAALQQAYLNRISQPPVIVVNPFPVQPVYNPYSYTPATTTFRYTGITPDGTLFESTKSFYRPAAPFNPFGGGYFR